MERKARFVLCRGGNIADNYQELKKNYKSWGSLTEIGIQEWGHVFPDNLVPLKSIIPLRATLEGKPGIHDVYMVDVLMLTVTQYNLILERISERSGFDVEDIKKDFDSDGFIPMSSKWIGISGTSEIHMFI